jgi:hypothetical protein
MQHIIMFVRDVPNEEAQKLQDLMATEKEHTHATFYPYRNLLSDYGFCSGEVMITNDDGSIIAHTLVNIKDTVIRQNNNCLDPIAVTK